LDNSDVVFHASVCKEHLLYVQSSGWSCWEWSLVFQTEFIGAVRMKVHNIVLMEHLFQWGCEGSTCQRTW
jgi:hypothetical protein